jgi:hypothetical protein
MSKSIDTLLRDIAEVLKDGGRTALLDPANYIKFSTNMGKLAINQVVSETYPRPHKNVVRASELGTKCLRQHYYKVNEPDKAEQLPGNVRFKFMYGNLIEEMVLLLAREAGHTVEHEQEVVTYTTSEGTEIVGHIDAQIDGVVVDVKSASPYGFEKMLNKTDWDDTFGYKPQLSFYHLYFPHLIVDDPRFLLVDKVSGRLGYGYMETIPGIDLSNMADNLSSAAHVDPSEAEMALRRQSVKGHSRGTTLPTVCSYCAFKRHCWRDANDGAGLRAFSYSTGPVFFTEIKPAALKLEGFKEREIDLGEAEIPKKD